MSKYFKFLCLLLLLVSCSSLKSGQYVKLAPGQSLEDLAQQYGVPVGALLNANRSREIRSGSWVFVPQDMGILPRLWGNNLQYGSNEFSSDSFFGGRFLWPVPESKKVSSFFGMRRGKFHYGIDISSGRGTYIVAADDGIIIYTGDRIKGFGNLAIISHPDGLFTVYAHASKLVAKKGQKVYRGQVIAEVGSTGRSTGPHLHFEVRQKNLALNPLEYL